MAVALVAPHIKAVRDHLNARGVLTEAGRPPSNAGWVGAPGQSAYTGYAMVSRIGAIDVTAELDGDPRVASPLVNVQCVGGSEIQAEQIVDQVRQAMLDQSIVVPGRRLLRVWQEVGISTIRDDDETPPLWYAAERFRVWTVPL